jgi:hypothetical protein
MCAFDICANSEHSAVDVLTRVFLASFQLVIQVNTAQAAIKVIVTK